MITPLAMILSGFILGEELTVRQKVGGAVILGAALINSLNQDRFKQSFYKLFGNNQNS
jgi:drug/metabolite transporter (DMT)-like permease